jgi:ATP-dependent DNA helicase DinG
MLNETSKSAIRDGLKAIGAALPGFCSRPGQKQMIAAVANTLALCPDKDAPKHSGPVALVQCGTGGGKSLGYSLPALVLAREKGKKLVISTATVALQSQLAERDLPLFIKALGLSVTLEIAKGRSRYACALKLARVAGEYATQAALPDNPALDPQATQVIQLHKDLADGRWNGDRDSLSGIDEAAWSKITTDRHGCLGKRCPQAKACAQNDARKRVRDADVIVANHDLVLADLAMGGGKLLPPPEDCFFVFDEAHHLPDRAITAFAASHTIGADIRLLERAPRVWAQIAALLPTSADLAKSLSREATGLRHSLEEAHGFFSELQSLVPNKDQPRPVLDFGDSMVPEGFDVLGGNVLKHSQQLIALLDDIGQAADKTRGAAMDKALSDLGLIVGRVERILSAWMLFLDAPAPDQPPVAKWIEGFVQGDRRDFVLEASLVRAGARLADALWSRTAGTVLASATLTVMGGFEHFLRSAGLDARKGVTTVNIASPFDYASQGTITIPLLKHNPQAYSGHTGEVTAFVEKMAADTASGGCLVLFTSRRQMEEVAQRLPAPVRERVQLQGSRSKAIVLETHRARVDAGELSILFGLESFSEGLDLAGAYCLHVVITRLPFEVPTDPVLKTLSDWVAARGGDEFNEVFMPVAARKLEQRVGRLIRTETDRGVVSILDNRLWQKSYGRAMLRGLPPFRLMVGGRDVQLARAA